MTYERSARSVSHSFSTLSAYMHKHINPRPLPEPIAIMLPEDNDNCSTCVQVGHHHFLSVCGPAVRY
jgi:hypothetical protein